MKNSFFKIALLFFIGLHFQAAAQIEELQMKIVQSKGVVFGVTEMELIDELMFTMPGLGSSSRDMLTEQSVKPYMMPPRKIAAKGSATSYAIASCLEFYVNFDKNYKVNLSPDFIELNLGQKKNYPIKDAFTFMSSTGTVSAAIMPYESKTIPAGVFATEKYKIANFLHIFRPEMKTRQKVFEAKKALMRGNPVIIEMQIPENFKDLKNTKYWMPSTDKPTETHPFVIVGFDQDLESFEILSTYGSEWGRNGYMWVEFDDLAKYATDGFVMVPNQY
ncbi:MAG: C1 family peptidase [Saprospiraceae bacterium]|nr:C1 family peptidase [Saprospiraceae bacterium]